MQLKTLGKTSSCSSDPSDTDQQAFQSRPVPLADPSGPDTLMKCSKGGSGRAVAMATLQGCIPHPNLHVSRELLDLVLCTSIEDRSSSPDRGSAQLQVFPKYLVPPPALPRPSPGSRSGPPAPHTPLHTSACRERPVFLAVVFRLLSSCSF